MYLQTGRYFPFSTVDVIIFQSNEFLLTKRSIPPYKGMWHLPGGLIRKGERFTTAAKRVVKAELGVNVKLGEFLGAYENPIKTRHDISHVFTGTISKGVIKNDFQSTSVKFFKSIPEKTVPFHKKMLKDAIHKKTKTIYRK